MKKNNGDCFIVGIGSAEHEYTINGVKYIVSSRYAPVTLTGEGEHTFSDRLQDYIRSDFADLTPGPDGGKLNGEYACSAAGKEE